LGFPRVNDVAAANDSGVRFIQRPEEFVENPIGTEPAEAFARGRSARPVSTFSLPEGVQNAAESPENASEIPNPFVQR
jgi:hypothetical protein